MHSWMAKSIKKSKEMNITEVRSYIEGKGVSYDSERHAGSGTSGAGTALLALSSPARGCLFQIHLRFMSFLTCDVFYTPTPAKFSSTVTGS